MVGLVGNLAGYCCSDVLNDCFGLVSWLLCSTFFNMFLFFSGGMFTFRVKSIVRRWIVMEPYGANSRFLIKISPEVGGLKILTA